MSLGTSDLHITSDSFLFLGIELHTFAGYWRSSFFEGWGQIHIFGDDTLVQERDHAFVNIVLCDWWRVFKTNGTTSLKVNAVGPTLLLLHHLLLGCVTLGGVSYGFLQNAWAASVIVLAVQGAFVE